jgi:photosystem II stability/assembly factor-like uncharacterized protein
MVGVITILVTLVVLGVGVLAYNARPPQETPARLGTVQPNGGSGTPRTAQTIAWQRVSANAIVHGLITDPRDALRLYAATTRGVMRSLDGGKTWALSNHGLPSTDPAVWTITFFDAGEALALGGDSSHIFVSYDRGLHWKPEPIALGTGGVYAITVDPGNSRLMLAGAKNGIWRSTDAGIRWSQVFSHAGFSVSALAWAGTSSGTVFAGITPGPRQIMESNNGGRTWRDADNGLNGDEGIMALGSPATEKQPGGMLAGTMGHRVWRFNPSDMAWSPSATGLPAGSHGAALLSFGGAIWLGTMGNGIYTSTDGGQSWAPYGPPLAGFGRIVLSLLVADRAVLAGTAQGIYRLAFTRPT